MDAVGVALMALYGILWIVAGVFAINRAGDIASEKGYWKGRAREGAIRPLPLDRSGYFAALEAQLAADLGNEKAQQWRVRMLNAGVPDWQVRA